MPTCRNCGSFITARYVRVLEPTGSTEARVCPDCTDKIRDGAGVRDSRTPRK